MQYQPIYLSLIDTFKYFSTGCTVYLSIVQQVKIPPNQFWYCTVTMMIFFTASLCSTLFIMNMTFDRFYSIIKPHKAASFNTTKRAKSCIVCIVIFSILFNIPHFFVTSYDGPLCLPFGDVVAMANWYSQFYYWVSFTIQFVFPFVSLLVMNSVIIHTLRKRLKFQKENEIQKSFQTEGEKGKSSEAQVYAILLLVTFAFLILVTPGYIFFILNLVIDFMASPLIYSGFILFSSTAQKLVYTNHGINFFLYVISGQKFRTDLKRLFRLKRNVSNVKEDSQTNVTDVKSNISLIETWRIGTFLVEKNPIKET